ncbi:UDP-N-acetylmuramoyl-L-alanyl-D-glutamate--2,6-diaminopimelate ligase [Leptotrichia hongkongensis]|uniref:UDP-N-acetylmuramoyl-L-alanyl-D-glutamate--2, 6-diaminopimelate ligase n=1 Tax=Leptotrichia hongkongensis TaxID=554406 RepID=UPI0035A97EEC
MNEIFRDVEYEILKEGKKFEIKGIEYDSRKIKEDFIFVAMAGNTVDGHDFIQKAIDSGAKIIITEKNINILEYKNADDVSFVLVKNIRKKLGIIASNYYGYPQNKIKIIGITGTNGKTTSSFILENILEKTARIGTTGNRILDEEFETVNTTPESLELIKLIDKSVKKGADYFIMEVSSHALEIGRVDMLKFDSAIFTNLTQDHLDFHKTMENYFNAKKKIFSMLRNDKNNGKGIINIDDEHGAKIYSEKNKDNYISISIKNEEADILGDILNYTNNGMKVKINLKNYFKKINSHFKDKDEEYEEEYKFEIGLIGEYNLYNVLGCVASALSFGIKMNDIIKKLETMPAVPGRFETIKNNMEARIVVDFAHTDDGLLNVGKTLKQITDNQVITIFGAGGDRDHDKRAKMAKAAIQFSDYIILTSDNPRTENPINILADIEKGLIDEKYPFDKYLIISDRERAIKHGIKLLKKGDSLLIAGKGHENYQIIGTQKIHFDDRETVRKILEEENNI